MIARKLGVSFSLGFDLLSHLAGLEKVHGETKHGRKGEEIAEDLNNPALGLEITSR